MKKTLLPLLVLPLLTLGLVGCDNGTTKQGTWTELTENQTLKVCCGVSAFNFSFHDYDSVAFRVDYEAHNYDFVTAIQVKALYSNRELNYEFKGNTISYVLMSE